MRNVLTKDKCFEIAKQCKTRSEFKSASNAAYNKARINGWIKDYTWFDGKDTKPNFYWNNYEHCKEEAEKYSSIGEFSKCNSAAYKWSKKNGWLNDFYDRKQKPNGYWNNYERCRELALDCTSRSEFLKRNSAAYKWSKKNGWIDSFDWLIDGRIYNDGAVDCVYAYEFDKFNAVYVGRTLMRRKEKRDHEHRHGKYTDNDGKTHFCYDGVLSFSLENDCEIPSMIVLEENLTIFEGRDREDYWKNDYYNKGWSLINKAKTGIYSGSLGSLDKGKWTKETCREIAITCKTKSEFKNKNASAYQTARINGWLNDYTWFTDTSELKSVKLKNFYDKNRIWTREKCYELALTCKTSSEFQYKSGRAYAASKKYGWFDDYTWFVSGFTLIEPSKWTKEACREIAITCKTKSEFKNKNSSAYTSARKNGWLDEYDWFIDGNVLAREKHRKYTYEKCYEIASSCDTASKFKSVNRSAYAAARTNGWLKDYMWFKNGRNVARKWSNENLKQEAAKYIHERDFMLGSNIAYRKAKNNNKLNDLFNSMRFNFKGYFDVSGFELRVNSDIRFEKYKYLEFSSSEAQKAIFKFYKEEMQQGEGIKMPNIGRTYIEQTGFYDLFPKKPSWEKFKNEVCPIVLYSFEIRDGIVLLVPHNISENNKIYNEERDSILSL